MRILIISHYFPPLNAAGSHRVYSWVKYWSRWGNEIAVLTTCKSPSNGSLDLKIEPTISAQIKIHEIPYWTFKRQVIRPYSDDQRNQKFPMIQFKNRLTNLRRSPLGWLFDTRYFWISPALKCARKLYQDWPYQLIVSSFNPPASHIIASQLKRKLNVFWVADYRDLWSGNHEYHARGPFLLIERILENYTIRNANLISSVSDTLCHDLEVRFRKPIILIENGYDSDDSQPNKITNNIDKQNREIVYTGAYYPEYNLIPLFMAIIRLKEKGIGVENRLKIKIFSREIHLLKPIVEKYKIADVVDLPGYIPWDRALEQQKKADALLFLEWANSSGKGVLSAKVFEYMTAGKPILSIGSPSMQDGSKLIEQTGTGIYLGDSISRITETLENLLEGKPIQYKPDYSLIKNYTREKQAKKMIDAIAQEISAQSYKAINPD
jgi:hypothetical protein